MRRRLRRVALLTVGGMLGLLLTALAPPHPAARTITDYAILAELPRGEVPGFLRAHYGLAPEALDRNPAVVAAWWNEVPRLQRTRLVVRMPEVIGNLAGVDFASRDRANRAQLELQLGEAAEAVAFDVTDDAAATRLRALRAIAGALRSGDGPARALIQLTRDGPPLAAIAVGDPDTADQVTFMVPGMGNDSVDAELWTRAAQNLYVAQAEAGASVRNSVIAWMGYRPPPVGLEATHDPHATRGAELLTRDIAGLRAARGDSQPYVNVVAHSYGATTAALALSSNDLDLYSFVMLGSAGIATAIPSADRLHAKNVYAGEASEDQQARWGRIDRRDPMDPEFGAVVLPVDGSERLGLLPVTGHQPIVHSPWNDDPQSPLWLRYQDAEFRERQYQRHMDSYGYFDVGTQSLVRVAAVTAAPIDRERGTAPARRAIGSWERGQQDERGPASAGPLYLRLSAD